MRSRLGEAVSGIKQGRRGTLPAPHKVRAALDLVRPGLLADGGNVEFQRIDPDGTVRLVLQGECRNCPSAEMTFRLVIEPILKAEVPEISSIIAE